jgi:hypothetical protein
VLQYIAAVEARDARLQTAPPPPIPRGPRAAKKPVKKTAKKPTSKTAAKRPPPKASARKRKTRATRPRGAR